MAVPRRKHSKARRDKRRTHYKLAQPVSLTNCDNCGAAKMPHRVCPACGYYKGKSYRTIVNE